MNQVLANKIRARLPAISKPALAILCQMVTRFWKGKFGPDRTLPRAILRTQNDYDAHQVMDWTLQKNLIGWVNELRAGKQAPLLGGNENPEYIADELTAEELELVQGSDAF
jgi:hypothetical protein